MSILKDVASLFLGVLLAIVAILKFLTNVDWGNMSLRLLSVRHARFSSKKRLG